MRISDDPARQPFLCKHVGDREPIVEQTPGRVSHRQSSSRVCIGGRPPPLATPVLDHVRTSCPVHATQTEGVVHEPGVSAAALIADRILGARGTFPKLVGHFARRFHMARLERTRCRTGRPCHQCSFLPTAGPSDRDRIGWKIPQASTRRAPVLARSLAQQRGDPPRRLLVGIGLKEKWIGFPTDNRPPTNPRMTALMITSESKLAPLSVEGAPFGLGRIDHATLTEEPETGPRAKQLLRSAERLVQDRR